MSVYCKYMDNRIALNKDYGELFCRGFSEDKQVCKGENQKHSSCVIYHSNEMTRAIKKLWE